MCCSEKPVSGRETGEAHGSVLDSREIGGSRRRRMDSGRRTWSDCTLMRCLNLPLTKLILDTLALMADAYRNAQATLK
jgi:hypothetical protein